jgi:hypothetical protein
MMSSANMAAIIVNSTTSMGIAFKICFPERWSLQALYGGGARVRRFSKNELTSSTDLNGNPLQLQMLFYDIIGYLPLDDIEILLQSNPGTFACQVPLQLFIQKCNVVELQDLCRLHGIAIIALQKRKSLLEVLSDHECHPRQCNPCATVLQGKLTRTNFVNHEGDMDIEHDSFLKTCKIWTMEAVQGLILPDPLPPGNESGFKVGRVKRGRDDTTKPAAHELRLTDIPLNFLAERLTVDGMRAIGWHHGILMPSNIARPIAIGLLCTHECTSCAPVHFYLVSAARQNVKKPKPLKITSDIVDFDWESYIVPLCDSYPPKPIGI